MKKFYILFFLFYSGILHAKPLSQQCPLPISKPNIEINLRETPLSYDYNKNTRELQLFSNKKIHNHSTLGLFQTNQEISIKPEYHTLGNDQVGYCGAIKKITIDIHMKPTIYIAQEATRFTCTKHRVEQHELLHYKFEKLGLKKYVDYLKSDMPQLFSQNINFKTLSEFKTYISNISKHYLNAKSIIDNTYTNNLHLNIDNENNYKIESNYCSDKENQILSKIIRNI